MLVWSLLRLAGAQIIPTYYETGPGNLPTDTDISVTVVVDEAWVNTEGLSSGDVENILRPVLQGYNSGGLEVTDFRQITLRNAANISQEVDFGKINNLHLVYFIHYCSKESTRVLVTLANCENSHLMNAVVQDYPYLMHVGLSEGKCERFLGAGVMMPVMAPGEDIVQLITDFKWANTFHNWTSYVIFMDDSVNLDLENQLHDILSRDSSLAMIRLGDRFVITECRQ